MGGPKVSAGEERKSPPPPLPEHRSQNHKPPEMEHELREHGELVGETERGRVVLVELAELLTLKSETIRIFKIEPGKISGKVKVTSHTVKQPLLPA